jgi:nucleoside-diphosphate-sugar epimerase
MTRVLLTGGNGFIAAHTLDLLLKRGHSVVTTVRTQQKVEKLTTAYELYVKNGQLGFAIVPDIATPGAFDKAVISNPPFEAVLHMASPNRFNITDIKKDLIDPAVEGTVGILKSIKASASSVKRVVITSSFAAMADASKGTRPGHVYQEEDWNPVTEQEAQANAIMAYSAGKTFAEKAAWDFLAGENPAFDIAVINPPMVFGPVVSSFSSRYEETVANEKPD